MNVIKRRRSRLHNFLLLKDSPLRPLAEVNIYRNQVVICSCKSPHIFSISILCVRRIGISPVNSSQQPDSTQTPATSQPTAETE
jgi:hypothetical protein